MSFEGLMGVILLAIFVAAVLFWPGRLPTRWKRWLAAAQREQVEDALKILLDHKWENRPAFAGALAASLHLSEPQMLQLATRIESQGLVKTHGHELILTAEGERWALQVMRAHRLWERYLADEARMPLERIHKEAHRMEHGMTPEQVDELDAVLGHPTHDPHGDPIPSRSGHILSGCGTPLTDWPLGLPGRVAHLEDEPPLAFAQILAEGVHLGQTLRILQFSPERYVVTDGENEYRLAPAIAQNVCLAPLPEVKALPDDVMPLAKLGDQVAAQVVALDEACQGFTRRRFLDLGLTPGTLVYPELSNSFGDPRAYRVRGTLIALRHDQATQIMVQPVDRVEMEKQL